MSPPKQAATTNKLASPFLDKLVVSHLLAPLPQSYYPLKRKGASDELIPIIFG